MAPWPFPSSGYDASRRSATTQQAHEQEQELKSRQRQRSSEESSRHRDGQQTTDPFVGIRRFADEQMQILADGIATIPAILSDLHARGSTSSPSPAAGDVYRRHWSDTPPAKYSAEAIAAARALLIQSRNANAEAGVKPAAVLNLYRDHPAEALLGHITNFFEDSFSPQYPWLSIDWFKHSKYSPTNIETHDHTHQHGSMWRAAFEDLLSASLGKHEESARGREAWTGRTNDQTRYAAWAATPRDWMLGLQCRGVLPPQLPVLYRLPSTRLADHLFNRLTNDDKQNIPPIADFWQLVREVGTFDADEQMTARDAPAEQSTELDAYEHFLGQANDKSTPPIVPAAAPQKLQPAQEQQPTYHPAPVEPTRSPILSTLSTTERTTLPDGTVTTKVVLRKRFADGREENTETVSTTHSLPDQAPQSDSLASPGQEIVDKTGDKQDRAWFWN